MDLPHRDIRFATTDDGVGIAFWEIGSGMPLVIANSWSISHAELEWTVPSVASFYVELAERYRLIRFDPRGIGLSDDPPGGWEAVTSSGAQQAMSTHEMGLDISAVAKACGLDSFALMAVVVQGPVAIEYAATHPDSVTPLILCDAVAKIDSSYLDPFIRGQMAIAQSERELGVDLPVTMWERLVPGDELAEWANLIRHARSRQRLFKTGPLAQMEWNAEPFLGSVVAPTLVLSARNPDFDFLSTARRLAAGIPRSQLRVVNGKSTPYVADRVAVHEAIDALLNPNTGAPYRSASGFLTVVFTDIVQSTEFVRRVGDERGRAAVRDLEEQVAALASKHSGRVVKNLGDGSLLSFGSNSSAIAFALDLQDACSDGPLQMRVGMAAGEPIQEDGDIHGTVVAQASRIGDLGDAGEVIVSDTVRQLAAGKGFDFEPRGEASLKGFDEPERVWNVTQTDRT